MLPSCETLGREKMRHWTVANNRKVLGKLDALDGLLGDSRITEDNGRLCLHLWDVFSTKSLSVKSQSRLRQKHGG